MLDSIFLNNKKYPAFIEKKVTPYVNGKLVTSWIPVNSTMAGAVNKVGGYISGVTSVDCNGFSETSRLVSIGDQFKFAGDTAFRTITETTLTAGVTTNIVFTPATSATLLDDAMITIVNPIDCIFWRGSMADAFISDKYKAVVSAIALLKPTLKSSEIPKESRIAITGIGNYSIVCADDIAEQNKVLVLQLTEIA